MNGCLLVNVAARICCVILLEGGEEEVESALDKVVWYGKGKQLKIGKVNFLKHRTMRLLLLIALFQRRRREFTLSTCYCSKNDRHTATPALAKKRHSLVVNANHFYKKYVCMVLY